MKGNKKFLFWLSVFTAGFVLFCGVLILQTGLFKSAPQDKLILLQNVPTQNAPRPPTPTLQAAPSESNLPQKLNFTAVGGPAGAVIIGAADPNTEDPQTGFKL